MKLLLLAVLLVAFYPYSQSHYFSSSHPDPLFLISHATPRHLAFNVLSLFLVWLIAEKVGESETRLLLVFFGASYLSLFIPVLFGQPVIGASAGIYAMVGYLLPSLVGLLPLYVSYLLFFPIILLEDCFLCNPWGKLFHIFGLTLGVLFHYFFDYHAFNLRKTAMTLGLGVDYYSLKGWGYPTGYVVYKIKK